MVPWFVVFFPAAGMQGREPWWLRGLHPGYAHCLACRAEGQNLTHLVDHRGTWLRADTACMPIGRFLQHMQSQAEPTWILAVPPAEDAKRPRETGQIRGPMTCTEAVKAALGLSAPWVFTPRQLARHLRRHHGARPVLPVPA